MSAQSGHLVHHGYAPAHPKNVSEEYLSHDIRSNYYQTIVPPTRPEYQYSLNTIPHTMPGTEYSLNDYRKHAEYYYTLGPMHDTSSYPTQVGSLSGHEYPCSSYPGSVDGRSGSFSSLSSSGSASNFSPSQVSDYSTSSNLMYPDMAYYHPYQSETQPSYSLHGAPTHSSEVINTEQFGTRASCFDRSSQSTVVPAQPSPTFQIPYLPPQPPSQTHPSVLRPTRPIPIPAQRRLFEQPRHFATLGVEQQPQPSHPYSLAKVNPIPLHQPQPRRLTQPTVFVDESPHHPSSPPSPELSTPLKSPILESLTRKLQRGRVPVPPTVTSIPAISTFDTTEDDDQALLLRASAGILRRPWPCKYEDQVFTSEDMKLPAVKRRRIYVNSLEQACNQMHALLQQHGLLPPPSPNPNPRPSYLPHTLKPRETKLSIIKAQYETTTLRDRLAFLTEIEKTRHSTVSDEPVVLHPHSDSTFT